MPEKDAHTEKMEQRKQDHRDHLQDVYNKTYKVVKDVMNKREEKIKRTI